MATSRETQESKTKGNGREGEWKKLPEPIIVSGFVLQEEGNVCEGVIMERDEGQYGGFYKVKLARPCKVKDRDGIRTAKIGDTVGINENAKLRQLQKEMRQGPLTIRVKFLEERPNGKGWEMDVDHRPAF